MNQKQIRTYIRRHLAFGWWSLLLFLSLGIVLEALHGLKISWYLNVGMETRRLLWRLAHAHGTMLSLVHLAFASTLSQLLLQSVTSHADAPEAKGSVKSKRSDSHARSKKSSASGAAWYPWASRCLVGASVGVPGGFFLGGVVIRGGDPGAAIVVLPIGAALLLVAVFLAALAVSRTPDG